MIKLRQLAFVAASLAAAGCGGGGGGGTVSNGKAAGTWQRTSGGIFSTSGSEVLDFLDLKQDGTGVGYTSDPASALNCHTLAWSVLDGNNLTIDTDADDPAIFRYERAGDALTLTDSQGRSSTFTRVASVPAASICKIATVTSTFSPPTQKRGYYDALVYDGTALWFEGDDDKIHPIDPASGSEGTAMVLSSGFAGIQGSAGGGFWAICNCGSQSDWQLRNVGGAKLDEFTFTGLGLTDNYSTDTGAFDGQFLWVNAYDYTTATRHLLKIDPTGPGSVVGNSTYTGFFITGMTFHGGKLWALYNGTPNRLVQLNPATMTVNDTVILPQGYFTGVGSDGTDVFLLGEDPIDYHTIVEKLQGVP